MNRFLFLYIILSSVLMCSCNDDLFVRRETNGISVSDDALQPSGGKTYVHFDGSRYEAPSVEVEYVYENNRIQIAQETIKDGSPQSINYNDIFSMSAEYDASQGLLTIDLDYSLIATDVIVRVRHVIYSESSSDWSEELAEIMIKPSEPAELKSLDYAHSYTVRSDLSSRITYNYVNSADTAQIFTLPKYLRPTSIVFNFENYGLLRIFGDDFPEVYPAIVEDGKVTILDQPVILNDLRQSLCPGGEIDDRYREFKAPPRTLLQVGITFIETQYSIPFTGYAVCPSAPDREPLQFFGKAKVSEYVVDTVGYRYLDLETGEEVIP